MNNVKTSKWMLEQASRRLKAVRIEMKRGSPAYSVRIAQESAELSLKAALRFVGIEYPKKHDVSRVLQSVKERFPSWFDTDRLAEIGTWLAERREPAMYGNEAKGISPDELFTKEDAKIALNYAEDIYNSCKRLIGES
jgi:HEPN domain-containing protein